MQEKINNVRKIGVISDTHIPSRAASLPAKVFEHFNGADLLIHCGDIVETSVLTELEAVAPVLAVKGNMDGHDIREPAERVLIINGRFVLCLAHGTGGHNDTKQRLYSHFLHENPYMIIHGHTHFPETGIYNGVHIFNPGSATNGHEYDSIGMLEVNSEGIKSSIIRL
jgi:hypothetical protein